MNRVDRRVIAVLGVALSMASVASAKGPEFVDPAKADQSYHIQGEYAGRVRMDNEEISVGVQVIALGKNRFRAVGFPGGLPGDGWTNDERHEVEGELSGGKLEFRGENAAAEWTDGQLKLSSSSGDVLGTIKRIERKSTTLGKAAPESAVVLFDGTGVDKWENGKLSDDGLLMQGTSSIAKFASHRLHIEFRLPYQPENRGQQRGNSGIYLQGRYEVQMLDSFGLEPKNNECGGVYSISEPELNMCYPPLTWQTYDIEFYAAKYADDGTVERHPRMTVHHNGVLIHKDLKLPKSTTASPNKPGPEPGPVYLQDHSNPVRYRNIWVEPIEG